MSPIHATYENGVFRPLTAVDLPEHCEVTVVPLVVAEPESNVELQPTAAGRERLHDLLTDSIETGITDLAARHNEYQW
jgi:predicted DNA-binding antitoxin AbrB/MazE fold protein